MNFKTLTFNIRRRFLFDEQVVHDLKTVLKLRIGKVRKLKEINIKNALWKFHAFLTNHYQEKYDCY